MNAMSHQFTTAIDLRFEFALNQVFSKHGLEPDIEEHEIEVEAHILGCTYAFSEGIRKVFEGTPLESAYVTACNEYEALRAEIEESNGSQEEWDALSAKEQDKEWDNFHHLCERGIADTMYFYQVLMGMHMVGYVGH